MAGTSTLLSAASAILLTSTRLQLYRYHQPAIRQFGQRMTKQTACEVHDVVVEKGYRSTVVVRYPGGQRTCRRYLLECKLCQLKHQPVHHVRGRWQTLTASQIRAPTTSGLSFSSSSAVLLPPIPVLCSVGRQRCISMSTAKVIAWPAYQLICRNIME